MACMVAAAGPPSATSAIVASMKSPSEKRAVLTMPIRMHILECAVYFTPAQWPGIAGVATPESNEINDLAR